MLMWYRTIHVLERLDRTCRSGKIIGNREGKTKGAAIWRLIGRGPEVAERAFLRAHVLQFLPPHPSALTRRISSGRIAEARVYGWQLFISVRNPDDRDALTRRPETAWSSTGTSSLRSPEFHPVKCSDSLSLVRNFKLVREWILQLDDEWWMIERGRTHHDAISRSNPETEPNPVESSPIASSALPRVMISPFLSLSLSVSLSLSLL